MRTYPSRGSYSSCARGHPPTHRTRCRRQKSPGRCSVRTPPQRGGTARTRRRGKTSSWIVMCPNGLTDVERDESNRIGYGGTRRCSTDLTVFRYGRARLAHSRCRAGLISLTRRAVHPVDGGQDGGHGAKVITGMDDGVASLTHGFKFSVQLVSRFPACLV